MINSITSFIKEEQTQSHQWVMFRNPRNGLIQISACKNCGTMEAPALASRTCQPIVGKHSMLTKGWVSVSSPATVT